MAPIAKTGSLPLTERSSARSAAAAFSRSVTSYSGTASSAGTLKLFYFDSNNIDNSGSIVANVTAVPEPESYAMLLAGLGLMGAIARRRKPAA